jgi:hypothetical protein
MNKKPKDRHLDVPSEANRDKHINFRALENKETDPADEPATGSLASEEDKNKARTKVVGKKKKWR